MDDTSATNSTTAGSTTKKNQAYRPVLERHVTVIQMDDHLVNINCTSEDSSNDKTSTSEHHLQIHDRISVKTKNSAPTRKTSVPIQPKVAHHRLLATVGILIIIGLFLVPVVLYYTQDRVDLSTLTATRNISNQQLLDSCNTSVANMYSTCVIDVINTYEAIRSASQFTYQFCIDETKDLFCEALQNCNNVSYAKDIVCQQVRQEYCTAEWRISEIEDEIIDCDEYGETAKLNCSDQFSLAKDGSVCLPLCRRFSQYNDEMTTTILVVFNVVNALNAIGGITVLIASYWNRKKMFRYPQVLIVINACLWTIEGFFIGIGSTGMGKWNPLCSGEFLVDSYQTPSVFTQIQGAVIHSVILLYNLLWFIYFSHLFMIVACPFHSSYISAWQNSKNIHIVELTCAFLLGITPNVFAAVTSQFQIVNFPPLFAGVNKSFYCYGILLPNLVVTGVDLILMLCTLYKIHVNYGIFKRRGPQRKRTLQLTVPEVKIFLTFCYLLVLMSILWTRSTLETSSFSRQAIFLVEYIQCMSGGVRRGLDCGEFRRNFENGSYPELTFTHLLLYIFLNFSNLPFVIEYQTTKQPRSQQK